VTSYPKGRTRRWGIPDEKVVSLPFALLLTRLVWKLGGEAWAMKLQFRINDLFARQAARHLGRPDLVHAWSGAAEPSLRVARQRGIPTVLERSSAHMLEQCRLLRAEYSSLGLRWAETPSATVERELREYAMADQVFIPSRFVERTFAQEGYIAKRLFLNGLGVDVRSFSPGTKTDGVFRVVFAGSLGVRKGIHHLVAAFRKANIPNSELLLVGGAAPETDRLIGAPDPRIRLIGHVPQNELLGHYRQASVFALASIEDGFGMVLAQALACGLPIVSTANTGGEDLLRQDGPGREITPHVWEYASGVVVPPGDSAALAGALQGLAADPVRCARMRQAAVALARRDLSWRRYAAANLDQYKVLVQAARKPGAERQANFVGTASS
jgi:glycosyltransferase involved in cell wall biosynthesis